MGFYGFLLFLFGEHHSRNFTYPDSDTNTKSDANTNANADSHTKSDANSNSKPNAYADSGAWNHRC
jgi:hypothetical protein